MLMVDEVSISIETRVVIPICSLSLSKLITRIRFLHVHNRGKVSMHRCLWALTFAFVLCNLEIRTNLMQPKNLMVLTEALIPGTLCI